MGVNGHATPSCRGSCHPFQRHLARQRRNIAEAQPVQRLPFRAHDARQRGLI